MAIAPHDKAQRFRDLHDRPCLVVPKPWNASSALALQGLGISALAASSGAAAAAEAARALPFPFLLTARVESFPRGNPERRRHHLAPAGLREGRRRRAVCTGTARAAGRARGARGSAQAGQLHDRHEGPVDQRRPTAHGRCNAIDPQRAARRLVKRVAQAQV